MVGGSSFSYILFPLLLTVGAMQAETWKPFCQKAGKEFDLGVGHHEQTRLIRNIAGFFIKDTNDMVRCADQRTSEKQLAVQRSYSSRRDFIREMQSCSGLCAGLSVLWSYAHYQEEKNMQRPNGRPCDDYQFFEQTYKFLALWDGKSPFNDKQKQDIERFVSHVLYFQRRAKEITKTDEQFDLAHTMENERGERPVELLDKTLSGVVTVASFTEHLKSAFKQHCMVVLIVYSMDYSSGHAVAAYYNKTLDKLFFYDPNNAGGQKAVNTVQDIVQLFCQSASVLGPTLEKHWRILSYRF